MALRVAVQGLDKLKRKSSWLDRDIREAVVDQIHEEVRGFEYEMHTLAMAYGKMAQIASTTLGHANTYNGGSVYGGGGRGLPGILFAGAEFGGRKRRKSYVYFHKDRLIYVHRRKTTMMFLTSLGTRGYFYFPTLRKGLVGQSKRMAAAGMAGAKK